MNNSEDNDNAMSMNTHLDTSTGYEGDVELGIYESRAPDTTEEEAKKIDERHGKGRLLFDEGEASANNVPTDAPTGHPGHLRRRNSIESKASKGLNGTTHLAVEILRHIYQSEAPLSDFEDDNAVPFLEDLLEVMEQKDGTPADLERMKKELNLFPKMELSFKDVGFAVSYKDKDTKKKVTKQILQPMTGVIPPGSMVAIMGPSGCGKTTFLDILSQKKTLPFTGEILINGHKPDKYFSRVTSYVPQFDYGSGLDTVFEAVEFVSKLKAPYTKEERKENLREKHIDFLLEILGLSKIKNSRVGDGLRRGISGGQRRRLTLLKGLCTGPGISFLDEPTSGLSSTDSELCVRALKNMSRLFGLSFITVIHQPKNSIFEMFDHLILLSEGHPVYNGPVSESAAYFSKLEYPIPMNTNPADHYLDVITPGAHGANPELFYSKYQSDVAPLIKDQVDKLQEGLTTKEVVASSTDKRTQSQYSKSRLAQYWVLQKREFRLLSRDVDEIVTILVNNLIMGIVTGVVYFQTYKPELVGTASNESSYQFAYLFMIIVMASLAALNSIPAMINSRIIFQNERSEGLYDILPFVMAKVILTVIVNGLLGNMTIMLSSYWFTGFPASEFMYMFAVLVLGFLAIESIVSFTSAMATSFVQANSLAGAVIGIMSLFNGFTANTISTPAAVSWIQYLSPIFYTFQAIVVKIYGINGAQLFGLHADWGVWGSILILIGFIIVFKVGQYLALRFFNQLER